MQSSASETDEYHSGHELESGMLSRAREWTDLFPWLRLVRTLRVAGSPILIAIVALTFALWWLGMTLWLGYTPAEIETRFLHQLAQQPAVSKLPPLTSGAAEQHIRLLIPTSLVGAEHAVGGSSEDEHSLPWKFLGAIVWSLLVWCPTVLLLVRQGALLTAGRSLTGLRYGCTTALRQTPMGWLIAAVPFLCVAVMALPILLLGWLGRFTEGSNILESGLALLTVLLVIPCGILTFGANFAIPLGWAAVANESQRDALDSLSRGYEYLFRRPLHLVFYAFLAVATLIVVFVLFSGVAGAMTAVAEFAFALVGAPRSLASRVAELSGYLPVVVMITLLWSLIGGVYLLLRGDAGGQEVEDLWQPPPDHTQTLPTRTPSEPKVSG